MEQAFYAEYAQAEQNHWWFAARRRILEGVLRKCLKPPANDRSVLEVGTGTGHLGQMLSRYGWFVGSDLNWTALEYAKHRLLRLVAARLEQLPFSDAAFDAIFACDVLEHVRDDASALAELRRVCHPKGCLILTVPAFDWLWSPHDEINHHHRRYTRRRLSIALGQAGWRIQRMSYFNTFLFAPIALARLFSARHAGRARSDLARPIPHALSRVLEAIFASERALLARWNLPIGVSLLAVASPHEAAPDKTDDERF